MKYVFLVSHGEFAQGLAHAAGMLAGKDRDDLLYAGLKEDTGADGFTEELKEKLKVVEPEDEILLFGDIIGGSPLTTAANVISEVGLLPNTKIVGGVNLPFIITSILMKDVMETDELIAQQIEEARPQLKEFVLETEASDDDI